MGSVLSEVQGQLLVVILKYAFVEGLFQSLSPGGGRVEGSEQLLLVLPFHIICHTMYGHSGSQNMETIWKRHGIRIDMICTKA